MICILLGAMLLPCYLCAHGNGDDIPLQPVENRILYTAPWEDEREADMAVAMIKERARNGVPMQDVNAPTVHDARVEGRLLREKTNITRKLKAAITTGNVDQNTLADIRTLRALSTRISDGNTIIAGTTLYTELISAGFIFTSIENTPRGYTLAGHASHPQTIALLATTSALPAPVNTKTQKKSRGIAKDTCSRTSTDGVNLHTYALDTDKVDIFRLVLYRWEDGPFDRPAPLGAHIAFSSVIQVPAACSTRIPRGTHAASHTLTTHIPHASHTFGLYTHTHNNHTLPPGGLI